MKKTEEENGINLLAIPLTISILKKYASKDKPLTASEIGERWRELIARFQIPVSDPDSDKEATIKRNLRRYFAVIEKDKANRVAACLDTIFGGQIAAVGNKKKSYYFKPCLSETEVKMINSSITSNMFLSEDEKEYLSNRLALYTNPDYINVPDSKADLKTLDKINILQKAIKEKNQVIIDYGEYTLEDKNIVLRRPKGRNHAMTYNPYAMLWNEGSYYLIATHMNHDTILHFRVDRIISVQDAPDKSNPKKLVKRKDMPEELREYFKGDIFDPIAYTAKHPKMSIYNSKTPMPLTHGCTFLCKEEKNISILIDTFGPDKLMIATNPDSNDSRVAIHVRGVEEKALELFCIQQCAIVELIEPESIRKNVQKQLAEIAERYAK